MKNTLLQFIANVPSTNKLLFQMADEGRRAGRPLPPFFAIHTDFQSDGRGMGSNSWFGDPGKNMLVSFYFEPGLPAARQFLFNQYFALGALALLRRRVPQALVKWPNDLYVDGKKIAGILIEHVVEGGQLRHTVAGLGLNVNQERFPADIPNPTSLLIETGRREDVRALTEELWQILFDSRARCDLACAGELHRQYVQNMYLLGTLRQYHVKGEAVEAMIDGVDEYGRLVLRTPAGASLVCGFKEVSF